MKLLILCVGRLKEAAEREIVRRYLQRFEKIGAPLGFGAVTIVELAESKCRTASERKADEAGAIRKKIPGEAELIALGEHGTKLTSADFARRLGQERDRGVRTLCLVIGGPDGLDPSLTEQASLQLSFGRMTMPHGLIRAVLAEQLYRAATILAGHPYHRD
jgi:23S rRNA (pseudouridine1915-N3)-methyltransferase